MGVAEVIKNLFTTKQREAKPHVDKFDAAVVKVGRGATLPADDIREICQAAGKSEAEFVAEAKRVERRIPWKQKRAERPKWEKQLADTLQAEAAINEETKAFHERMKARALECQALRLEAERGIGHAQSVEDNLIVTAPEHLKRRESQLADERRKVWAELGPLQISVENDGVKIQSLERRIRTKPRRFIRQLVGVGPSEAQPFDTGNVGGVVTGIEAVDATDLDRVLAGMKRQHGIDCDRVKELKARYNELTKLIEANVAAMLDAD